VWVADNAEATLRAYDSTGAVLLEVGGRKNLEVGGRKKGIGYIQDFAVLDSAIVVLDSAYRLAFFPLSPGEMTKVVRVGREQSLANVGGTRLVLANSPAWTGPLPPVRKGWPLARVVSPRGDSLYEIGARRSDKNRFADHINNFVLPASGRHGPLWLARMNGPDVFAIEPGVAGMQRLERPIPFKWRAMPREFRPTRGREATPLPFDAITYSIASDTMGNAYVLTAVAGNVRGEPAAMAIDRFEASSPHALRRLTFTGHATQLTVSPSGSRLYIFDALRKTVRILTTSAPVL
jgi:hypothetical protein